MAIIYSITNNVNNKKYIGFTTKSAAGRFREHVRNAMKRGLKTPLYSAIRKYGEDAFTVEILCEHHDDVHTLTVLEPYYIELYATCTEGYNCTFGGEGTIGLKLTPERLLHLKTVNIGRKQDAETVKNRREKNTGKRRNDASKRRYSDANKRRLVDGTHNFQKIKGFLWVCDEKTNISRRVSPEDAELLVLQGWGKGRINTRQVWMNDGTTEKMIPIDQIDDNYADWSRGRLKARVA